MAHRYTDVDLMIFKRWDEVRDLRGAFDDLLDRIADVVESSLREVAATALEKGFFSDVNLKRPSIWFWKPTWATRKREAAVYLEVFDFVPAEYGKDVDDYPSIWFMTDQFSKLRTRESSEDFGRAMKAALSPELLKKWSHVDVSLAECPVGRDCVEVSEADRVRWVNHPDELVKFALGRLDECMDLVPAIDQALQQMNRR